MIYLMKKSLDSLAVIGIVMIVSTSCVADNVVAERILSQINILYEKSYDLIDVDDRASLKYSLEALKLSESICDSAWIVKCGRVRALGFRRIGKLDSALLVSLKVIPIAQQKNLQGELGYLLNGLTLAYVDKSVYDKALRYGFESLHVREKNGGSLDISVSLNNIGLVYFKLDDLDKALDYYLKSLEVKTADSVLFDLELLLSNISLCYTYKGQLSKAKTYLDRAAKLRGKTASDYLVMVSAFTEGLFYYSLRDFNKAEQEFRKSLFLADKLNHQRFRLDNVVHLSNILIARNDLKAVRELVEGSRLLSSNEVFYSEGLLELHAQMIRLSELSGDSKGVVYYQRRYIDIKNQLHSYEFTRNLMKVEGDHIERENQAKIATQQEILLLNNQLISSQRKQNLSFAVIIVLLVGIVAVLFRNNRIKQSANLFLEKQVRARTRELESNYGKLMMSFDERKLQMSRMSHEVTTAVATIRGLCVLGTRDIGGAETCFEKIQTTIDSLVSIMSRHSKFLQ